MVHNQLLRIHWYSLWFNYEVSVIRSMTSRYYGTHP